MSVHDLVIADIQKRAEVGLRSYGEPLVPFNGRNALRDAYEEALDLACYLRQALEEEAEVFKLRAALESVAWGYTGGASAKKLGEIAGRALSEHEKRWSLG